MTMAFIYIKKLSCCQYTTLVTIYLIAVTHFLRLVVFSSTFEISFHLASAHFVQKCIKYPIGLMKLWNMPEYSWITFVTWRRLCPALEHFPTLMRIDMQNVYLYTWNINKMNKVSTTQNYFCNSTEECRNWLYSQTTSLSCLSPACNSGQLQMFGYC